MSSSFTVLLAPSAQFTDLIFSSLKAKQNKTKKKQNKTNFISILFLHFLSFWKKLLTLTADSSDLISLVISSNVHPNLALMTNEFTILLTHRTLLFLILSLLTKAHLFSSSFCLVLLGEISWDIWTSPLSWNHFLSFRKWSSVYQIQCQSSSSSL